MFIFFPNTVPNRCSETDLHWPIVFSLGEASHASRFRRIMFFKQAIVLSNLPHIYLWGIGKCVSSESVFTNLTKCVLFAIVCVHSPSLFFWIFPACLGCGLMNKHWQRVFPLVIEVRPLGDESRLLVLGLFLKWRKVIWPSHCPATSSATPHPRPQGQTSGLMFLWIQEQMVKWLLHWKPTKQN